MNRENRISLYVIAGVRTAPHFMEEFRGALVQRLAETAGAEALAEAPLLFPYGDWSRPVWRQAAEVWHDIRLPFGRLDRSIGGQAVLAAVGAPATGQRVLLAGHSGGGTAAVHAAALLCERRPDLQVLVLAIGAPRSPVPPPVGPLTAYYYASRPDGAVKDPVCRLGSWRQRSRSAAGPGGARGAATGGGNHLCRPAILMPLPIGGGHPDYFRSRLVNATGTSNLDQTLAAVWSFIEASWFATAPACGTGSEE